MTKKLLAFVMGAVVALCVGLVGCSGSGGSSQDNPAGVWDLQDPTEMLSLMGLADIPNDYKEAVSKTVTELAPEIFFININLLMNSWIASTLYLLSVMLL